MKYFNLKHFNIKTRINHLFKLVHVNKKKINFSIKKKKKKKIIKNKHDIAKISMHLKELRDSNGKHGK